MAAPRRLREVSLAEVSFGTFAPLINSGFVLREATGAAQALQLVEVDPLAPTPDSAYSAEEPSARTFSQMFSLFFAGDATRPLPQDTYVFEHAHLGRFEMFIVPVGCEDRSHCYYEAVFNRPPLASLPPPRLVHRLRTR
jgi:hypothetical protein